MTISATATAAPPRRLGRSVAALAFGFVAVVVLSLGTDELLHLLKVYPPWSQPMYDTGLCLLALSYRIVYTVLGSYIAARYAPHAPMGHALILGAVGTVVGTAGAVCYHPQHLGAARGPLADSATSLPGGRVGGGFFAGRAQRTTKDV